MIADKLANHGAAKKEFTLGVEYHQQPRLNDRLGKAI